MPPAADQATKEPAPASAVTAWEDTAPSMVTWVMRTASARSAAVHGGAPPVAVVVVVPVVVVPVPLPPLPELVVLPPVPLLVPPLPLCDEPPWPLPPLAPLPLEVGLLASAPMSPVQAAARSNAAPRAEKDGSMAAS
jgi:hypothetical protein